MENRLRILVVDDTVVYRKIVSDVLARIPGVEVVGTAANGRIALRKIEMLHPDLLTLDLEMPEIDGLAVLRELRQHAAPPGAIMLSAFTSQGASSTMAALELGAFDFVLKPNGSDPVVNAARLRADLTAKLDAYARARRTNSILPPPTARPPVVAERHLPEAHPAPARTLRAPFPRCRDVHAVVIGISTGGPRALTQMLPQLPANLAAPVLVVQHMPPLFTRSLAEDLDTRCQLRVQEASDGDPVIPGQILIAPGGRQMKVESEQGQVRIRITDDPPENSCRPSVDYLFRSAASVYGGNCLAVIMTGMGNDGTKGCRLLKERDAPLIAQDASTCVVFGMPREPIEQGLVDIVAPLDQIAPEIARLTGKRSLACK
jgi:two-component system chemotaxis response regulator CheB